tara:strand:+ start:123 stop:1064 length:942 start_codon:yes stop_codon:yes gene_type:complete
MDSLPQVNSSLKTSNSTSPNHQSVGRNGSFWLPPKASGSFESNLQRNIPEVKNSKNNHLPIHTRNPDGKTNHASPKGSDLNSKNILHKGLNSKGIAVKTAPKDLVSALAKPNQIKSKNSNIPANIRRDHSSLKENLSPHQAVPKDLKGPKPNLFPKSPLLGDRLDPDSEKKDGGAKNQSSGTRNAQLPESMSNPITSSDFGKNLLHSTSKGFQSKTQVLKNLTSKAIPPRISYLSKSDRKVVRFAIDLPDGGKLGVRIEKNNLKLSVSLICPNEDTQELISFLGTNLFQGAEKVKIGVFNSYHDMDLSNSLAA